LRSSSAQSGGVWLTSTATVMSAAESSLPSQPVQQVQPVELKTLGWALRRAAMGLAILLVATGFFAWLLYASIEPDGTRGPGAQSDYGLPPG
jgi:hypothetical protein